MSLDGEDFAEEPVESELSQIPDDSLVNEESIATMSSQAGGGKGSPSQSPLPPQEEPSYSSAHSDAASKKSALSSITGKVPKQAPGVAMSGHDTYTVPASQKSPEDFTQRYLRLLNSGRLASKEKHMRASGGTTLHAHSRSIAEDNCLDDPAVRSVYEPEIAKLRLTAKSMLEIEPIAARAGSARSRQSSINSPRQRQTDATGNDIGRASSAPRSRQQAHPGIPPGTQAGAMYKRLYAPGPGAYTPMVDYHGRWDASSFGFGTARQRPPHVCIQEYAISPGPVYLPFKNSLSTSSTSPTYRFGKRSVGTRTDLNAELPSNHPHFNPGPGQYETVVVSTGRSLEPGQDAPKPVFGSATKLVSPEVNFSATVFVSKGHAMKENVGVHSPGPARYSPGRAGMYTNAAQYTLAHKAPSYFDAFLDPLRQVSPGPIYNTGVLDRKGNRTWGNQARATFGFASKTYEPEVNLSATTFISTAHAHTMQGVHSPGPIYSPKRRDHVPTPLLASGPVDRFFDRFEPGRLQ